MGRKAKKAAQRAAELAAEEEESGTVSHTDIDTEVAQSGEYVPTAAEDAQLTEDVHVDKFTIYQGGKCLFKEARLDLLKGRRYGLVGVNGCGKTTLFNAIAKREEDFGKAIASYIDILLLEQEVQADDTPAIESVIAADTKRTALLEKQALLKQAEEDTKDEDVKDEIGEKLAHIWEQLEEIEADRAEPRASAILSGLQFTEEQKRWPTSAFSGGWRMRISLARALFRRPRLLLLDEPTNHLDLHAVIWLEGFLQKYPHTIMVVSHDRDFLNYVATDILHVFQQKLVHYKGNYYSFEKGYNSMLEQYQKDYEKQQKRLKQLQQSGKITHNVEKKGNRESKTRAKERKLLMNDKKGKASSSKKNKGYDEEEEEQQLGEAILEPLKASKMRIDFKHAGDCPMPLIKVEDVTFGYPGKEKLFKNCNFGINMDSRIALVGPNGSGKSTLLKLMQDELTPDEGQVTVNRKLRVGVFSQHSVDQLKMDLTPVEYIQELYPELKYQEIRNMLGKFGLPGNLAVQKIDTLSGGQKSRVVFVELGLKRSHILMLDEPTNHLDLETIDCLIRGLKDFEGGIVVVTHNVTIISDICDEIWMCGEDEDKEVIVFDGDFEEYREMLEERLGVNLE